MGVRCATTATKVSKVFHALFPIIRWGFLPFETFCRNFQGVFSGGSILLVSGEDESMGLLIYNAEEYIL